MNRSIRVLAAGLIAAAVLRTVPAMAQNEIYLRIQPIPGECKEDRHKDWIDVRALTDAMESQITAASGGKTPAQILGARSLVFTKPFDKASPLLRLNQLKGTRYPEVVIEVWRVGSPKWKIFEYRLREVSIKSVRTSFANGEAVEEVGLDFNAAEWSYTEYDSSGKVGTTIRAGWDFSKNSSI